MKNNNQERPISPWVSDNQQNLGQTFYKIVKNETKTPIKPSINYNQFHLPNQILFRNSKTLDKHTRIQKQDGKGVRKTNKQKNQYKSLSGYCPIISTPIKLIELNQQIQINYARLLILKIVKQNLDIEKNRDQSVNLKQDELILPFLNIKQRSRTSTVSKVSRIDFDQMMSQRRKYGNEGNWSVGILKYD